jgi:hypothetical protein
MAWPVKDTLFDLEQANPTSFPPLLGRVNQLGAAGASELVKGNWPKLHTLNIA